MTIVRQPNLCGLQRKTIIAVAVGALVMLVLLAIGLGVGLTQFGKKPTTAFGPAGVTAISKICAEIGRDVLRENGSAVDAAIATLFCETVSTPQSMGLGGGFVGVLYSRASRQAHSIVARESAPAAATRDMFNNVTRVEGVRAFAVPGELLGYAELHARFGRLPWRRLVQPSIKMCRDGYPITPFLGKVLHTEFEEHVRREPAFREIFWNEDEDRLVREGDIVQRLRYAETLELIAAEGATTMYEPSGTVAQRLVQDVRELGGLMTLDDLRAYRTSWGAPEQATIYGDKTLYAPLLPASGSVLVFIMNMLDGYLPESLGFSVTFYHRLVESFKFAYAKRSDLGDPNYVQDALPLVRNLTSPEFAAEYRRRIDDKRTFNETEHYGASFALHADHGTAHVSVLAPDGDAVAITSTVNTYFGCKIISPRTGIVLNDEMDDFSVPGKSNFYGLPASPANYIAPGKRPMSSMCPTIVVDGVGDVEIVLGAAGGSKITTSVATMIVRQLDRKQTAQRAMLEPRLHHQLLPMTVLYEKGFDDTVLNGLRELGHAVEEVSPDSGFGAVSAITRHGNWIEAVSDVRRNGSMAIL